MSTQVANALVLINNEAIAYTPNTLMFTEGLGEQIINAAVVGGNEVEQVYADNIETNYGRVAFEMPPTIENIAIAKTWKQNKNQNVVQIIAETADGQLTRTFRQAAITGDYEINLGSETTIPVEFRANSPI